MPKVGDVVLYTVQDKTYKAIVLFAHQGQSEHLGAKGQPLLHLAFIAPDRESETARKKLSYIPQVFIEYDVVHASQEFSEVYKQQHGLVTAAQIASQRGGGEWIENATAVQEVARAQADWLAALDECSRLHDEIEKLNAALAAVSQAVPDATGT